MKSTLTILVFIAFAVACQGGIAIAKPESKETTAIQESMDVNFKAVARILAALVEVQYESIPLQADILIQHADELLVAPPSAIRNAMEKEVFLSYATNLSTAAKRLKIMAESMAKADAAGAMPVQLVSDALRSGAAQRMGEIVSACTICHSQFRFHNGNR